MTDYNNHVDGLRLDGVDYCQLLSNVRTKVEYVSLKIQSATLSHGTHGLSASQKLSHVPRRNDGAAKHYRTDIC